MRGKSQSGRAAIFMRNIIMELQQKETSYFFFFAMTFLSFFQPLPCIPIHSRKNCIVDINKKERCLASLKEF